MKTKNKESEQLEQLLEKHNITKPIPDGEQKKMMAKKYSMYKDIVKDAGNWSLLHAIFSPLYFMYKKSGLWVFILKMITFLALCAGVVISFVMLVLR